MRQRTGLFFLVVLTLTLLVVSSLVIIASHRCLPSSGTLLSRARHGLDEPRNNEGDDISKSIVEDVHLTQHWPNSGDKVHVNMTQEEADYTFYRYVSQIHYHCHRHVRLGYKGEGGWDMCISEPFRPRKPCLIYSFGIGVDFGFDDAAADMFNCIVRAFDPSVTYTDHLRGQNIHFYRIGIAGKTEVNARGWNMSTVEDLMTKFNESKAIIDYLKMDVEFDEWKALQNMLTSNVLRQVKQLAVEIHLFMPTDVPINETPNIRKLLEFSAILEQLEEQGFRRWHWIMNQYPTSVYKVSNGLRSCCYELIYINANFLEKKLS